MERRPGRRFGIKQVPREEHGSVGNHDDTDKLTGLTHWVIRKLHISCYTVAYPYFSSNVCIRKIWNWH